MRFKVASRVRGLSDEAFREAFGTEEQCRAALCCSASPFDPPESKRINVLPRRSASNLHA